jgi:hypothetical protein
MGGQSTKAQAVAFLQGLFEPLKAYKPYCERVRLIYSALLWDFSRAYSKRGSRPFHQVGAVGVVASLVSFVSSFCLHRNILKIYDCLQ